MHLLLGPVTFLLDVAPVNILTGAVLTLMLLPGILLVVFRPRIWTAMLSVLALLAWMALGVLGSGIAC